MNCTAAASVVASVALQPSGIGPDMAKVVHHYRPPVYLLACLWSGGHSLNTTYNSDYNVLEQQSDSCSAAEWAQMTAVDTCGL